MPLILLTFFSLLWVFAHRVYQGKSPPLQNGWVVRSLTECVVPPGQIPYSLIFMGLEAPPPYFSLAPVCGYGSSPSKARPPRSHWISVSVCVLSPIIVSKHVAAPFPISPSFFGSSPSCYILPPMEFSQKAFVFFGVFPFLGPGVVGDISHGIGDTKVK